LLPLSPVVLFRGIVFIKKGTVCLVLDRALYGRSSLFLSEEFKLIIANNIEPVNAIKRINPTVKKHNK
jgi:hypothetical protein